MIPSSTVVHPAQAYPAAALVVMSITFAFCESDSGNHGAVKPLAR